MSRRSAPVDRISNLPCSIIDNILKYLPIRDAARTSILSREWKYKWVTIPHLVFDKNFEKTLNTKYKIESIIDHALLLHKGAITKFAVTCDEGTVLPVAIHRWLFFLLDHQLEIEDLELEMNAPGVSICFVVMPIHLFSFDHLKHLRIQDCSVKLPPTFRGFSRLAKLDLSSVSVELGDLITWLSKCPMLEYLSLGGSCSCLCVPKKLPEEPNHLIVLKLVCLDFTCRIAVGFLGLLRNSLKLCSLEIKCNNRESPILIEGEERLLPYLKKQKGSFIPLACLEDVKIDGKWYL